MAFDSSYYEYKLDAAEPDWRSEVERLEGLVDNMVAHQYRPVGQLGRLREIARTLAIYGSESRDRIKALASLGELFVETRLISESAAELAKIADRIEATESGLRAARQAAE